MGTSQKHASTVYIDFGEKKGTSGVGNMKGRANGYSSKK
jgi:hypothetical protein